MPAKSKSQQRLFGMVHAYNKGELDASSSLRKRIAALSKRISDTDAQHFAKTPHAGLPEKKAQVLLRPEDLQRLYAQMPAIPYQQLLPERSRRRRSFLGSVFHGLSFGSVVGSLGFGALGAYLASRAGKSRLRGAAAVGSVGAGLGAVTGALTGGGLHVLDTIRGDT